MIIGAGRCAARHRPVCTRLDSRAAAPIYAPMVLSRERSRRMVDFVEPCLPRPAQQWKD